MAEGSRTGTQFGVYRLDELIGRGGMGEVYRAYDTSKNRTVALKLLNIDLAEDPVYKERFRRESHAAARLQEPHVIPIHDWGEIDGVLYIDMRLVTGQDLGEVLRSGGAMPPARAVAIIEQVAGALDAAHREGLIHRDVKPENILLAEGDFAYLVDFGIAHSGDDAQLTGSGLTIGSYRYMAPERFDDVAITPAADIYSLTCVLYECLTGVPPYQADTITAAVKAHVLDPAPMPSRQHSGVPTGFDQVVAQGLAKDPEQRFSTAGQLAHSARMALDSARVDLTKPNPVAAPPPNPYLPAPAPGYRMAPNQLTPVADSGRFRSDALIALGALAVVALIGVGLLVWYFNFDDSSDDDPAVAVSTVTETRSTTEEPVTTTPPGASGPPPGATLCPAVYGPVGTLTASAIGTTVTSCAFAEEVRRAHGPVGVSGQVRSIVATSPVTGSAYLMTCTAAASTVTCVGGENAVVHLF